MDSATSHDEVGALRRLIESGVDVYRLPSHTSHVTQVLDSHIYSQFKQHFRAQYTRIKNYYTRHNICFGMTKKGVHQSRPTRRRWVVEAACSAWAMAAHCWTISMSWLDTGLSPYDPYRVCAANDIDFDAWVKGYRIAMAAHAVDDPVYGHWVARYELDRDNMNSQELIKNTAPGLVTPRSLRRMDALARKKRKTPENPDETAVGARKRLLMGSPSVGAQPTRQRAPRTPRTPHPPAL